MRLLFLTIIMLISSLCIQNSSQASRPLYNLSTNVFSDLPPFPEDFYAIDSKVSLLDTDLIDVSERYYKQPEFYPTFEAQAVELMKNPPNDRIGIIGLGFYPAEQKISTGGQEIRTAVFLHASWLVQTYQGLKIKAEYDEEVFDVILEPENVVLAPAYPLFENNWTMKINIVVEQKKSIQKGSYDVKITLSAPDKEQSKAWAKIYGNKYIDFFSTEGIYAVVRINL